MKVQFAKHALLPCEQYIRVSEKHLQYPVNVMFYSEPHLPLK